VAGPGPDRAPVAAAQVNRKWYGDGTEIDTDEGKLFLDSVLDMASRRVVGFALGEHHDAELAYAARICAAARRRRLRLVRIVVAHAADCAGPHKLRRKGILDWDGVGGAAISPAGSARPAAGSRRRP